MKIVASSLLVLFFSLCFLVGCKETNCDSVLLAKLSNSDISGCNTTAKNVYGVSNEYSLSTWLATWRVRCRDSSVHACSLFQSKDSFHLKCAAQSIPVARESILLKKD